MRAKVGGESCGSFMVGHKKQKSILVAAVLIAVFLIALYFNSRPKPFKPFTALIVSTTHAQSNTAGHESLDKDNLKYQVYNNSVQFDHLWFNNNCLETSTLNTGIENINSVVDTWKNSLGTNCRDLYMKFSDIYIVRSRSAPVVIPETFAPKVLKWLGGKKKLLEEASLQLITSVDNLYTQESTVFNPLRAKRPGAGGGATADTKKYVAEIVQATINDCDFCQYKTNTAQDPFGRVESQYTVSVSNTFKVEKFHSLVLWKHHNPLDIKEHELLDGMETAQKWFRMAHAWDKKYTIPHIYWDTLPRASASQVHPHFHVTLARDHYYAKWNHLYVAAKKYAEDHNGENYFSTLTKIYSALGLAVRYGNATVLAYLTPTASHEIMLISKRPCKDLFHLLYDCLTAFRDDMELYALSAGMVFPKFNPSPDGSDLPTIIRLVYRGAAEGTRADIDSLQLFGTTNVNVDPYVIISHIKKSVERRRARPLRQSSDA